MNEWLPITDDHELATDIEVRCHYGVTHWEFKLDPWWVCPGCRAAL